MSSPLSARDAGVCPCLPTFDLYGPAHKGLRHWMFRVVGELGRRTTLEGPEGRELLTDVSGLLAFARSHLTHEDELIHPLLEPHRPDVLAPLDREHVAHERALTALGQLVANAWMARGPLAEALTRELHLRLSVFVGESLVHMAHEEQVILPVLEHLHGAEALRALHARLVASLSQDEKEVSFACMLPALNARERAGLLAAHPQSPGP